MPTLESLSQVDDALLDYLVEGVEESIVRESVGIDWMKRSSKNVYGRNILMKTRTKGNAGAGAAPERGTLPRATARVFKEMQAKTRFVYVPVELTGPEMANPQGKKGAVLDLVMDAFADSMENGIHIFDNYFWGDGSGRLAQINGTPTYAAGTGLTTIAFDNGVKEMFLDGQNLTFGTDTTSYQIDYVDPDSDIIYVTGDCTSVAVDDAWIYNGGDYDSAYDVVPWGLKIHVNTTNGVHSTYQNVDRTATGYYWAHAYMNGNSGVDRPLTSLLMTQHLQKHKRRAGNRTPTKVYTEDGVLNSYVLLLESLHQPIETFPTEAGTKERYSYIFAGKRMVVESTMKCPQGYIYFLDDKALEIRESYKLQWDKEGGGKLTKDRNEDTFWGRAKWYYNIICPNPRLLSVMYDITRNAIT